MLVRNSLQCTPVALYKMSELLSNLPKFYIGLSLTVITLSFPYIASFYSSIRLSRALSRYPWANKTWDAAAKKHFLESADQIIRDGSELAKGNPFLMNENASPKLVLPPKYVNEIKNEKDLNFAKFIGKEFHSAYPGFDAFSSAINETIFQDAVRTQLAQVLTLTIEPLARETPTTLNKVYGSTPDWKETNLVSGLLKSVARLTSLVFLGENFMDNAEWQEISIMYTVDVFMAAEALNSWPAMSRPIVHWFLPQCRKIRSQVKTAKSLIRPEVERRRADIVAKGGKARRRVLDSVDWFTAAAKGETFDYTNAELSLAMASIHTTTTTLGFTISDLLENPEYIDMLREEIKESYEQDGKWEKSTLFKLKLMDSCIKESMRLHPMAAVNMPRAAVSDITLSDGTFIPRNTNISIGPLPMLDPELFPEPYAYNGRRFLDLRNAAGAENKYQLVTTTSEFTVFGHGTHACPGRFFASNEMKLLLAHMLLYYDWKFPEGQEKANHIIMGTRRGPNPKQKVMFKSREPEIDIEKMPLA
ncbi:cytochrome P450 [Amylocarpus encephaloides]|uniref:Cytochrome P450 n=1 Tax=Amylocarpus encephaloides TaxID=45428 RepID=A0A9P8C3N4_9HELO|nr:cytochrome P450 [Amylocarpus encephaloides]